MQNLGKSEQYSECCKWPAKDGDFAVEISFFDGIKNTGIVATADFECDSNAPGFKRIRLELSLGERSWWKHTKTEKKRARPMFRKKL